MLIEQRPSDDSEVIALVVDEQVELLARDGDTDGRVYAADPAARYLVAVSGGNAVACGALLALDVDAAEVAGLYVRPAYRGRGLGRQMLAALEDLAASRGHLVVRARRHNSSRLYESAGYRPIPPYGPSVHTPLSLCYEKPVIDPEAIASGLG